MTRENKLRLGLIFVSLLVLSLVLGWTHSLGWSLLAINSLIFVLCYPLAWACWQIWNFWCLPLMQLTTYAQLLKDGEQSLQLKLGVKGELISELQTEIEQLAQGKAQQQQQTLNVEQLVSQMMDVWHDPICLFDQDHALLYSNDAANNLIKQPILRGKQGADIGFIWQQGLVKHGAFQSGWECNTTQYHQGGQSYWLFSAVYIAHSLTQAEITSQKNLVRVLSHELRNSLTPMASMADTLLSRDDFNESQVRLVLQRIHQRSNRLLNFIQQYAQLSQLPKPQSKWFDFNNLLDEASAMLPEAVELHYHGQSQCFGDAQQLSQVLINVLTNAAQACGEQESKIQVNLSLENNLQTLTIRDNGQGFANLDNVLTPFYTTKSKGSGIGLALCAEIVRQHGGELKPSNPEGGGALIEISLPY